MLLSSNLFVKSSELTGDGEDDFELEFLKDIPLQISKTAQSNSKSDTNNKLSFPPPSSHHHQHNHHFSTSPPHLSASTLSTPSINSSSSSSSSSATSLNAPTSSLYTNTSTCLVSPIHFLLDLDYDNIGLTSAINNVRFSNFVVTITSRYKPDITRFGNPRIRLKERLIEYQKQQPFESFQFSTPSPDDQKVYHHKMDATEEVSTSRADKKPKIEPSTQVKDVAKLIENLQVESPERRKSPARERPTPSPSSSSASLSSLGTQVVGASKNQIKYISREKVAEEFTKERSGKKPLINLVVVGHVDAGKSTLMGHLLYRLGQVTKKNMHRYETDSKKIGKASFQYAWVLDETNEERARGITMDIAQSSFETSTKLVNLLDAPGHRDFIPNMITGAAQADAALLVVDATKGEFEAGFEAGGQTREHTLLIRSLGVPQIAVVLNKLDNVNWSKERFDEVVNKLTPFLKQVGYREKNVTFVPCSGLTGENLNTCSTNPSLTSWYSGPSLVQVIDSFQTPERPVSKPFRLSIADVYKGPTSGISVCGRIESGAVQIGQKFIVMPSNEQAIVKAISIEDTSFNQAFAGDQVSITMTGCNAGNITNGDILCDIADPSPVTTRFHAKVVVFNNVQIPLTKGYPVELHCKNLQKQATISKLISQLDKSNGQVIKSKPRCLSANSSGIVEITTSVPISIELYQEYKDLGRIMLRSRGATVAAGLVVRILS